MARQFCACAFHPGGRSYTYHNDGEPLAIGDRVRVETAKGMATIEVVALPEEAPPFETKPILGLADPDPLPPAA